MRTLRNLSLTAICSAVASLACAQADSQSNSGSASRKAEEGGLQTINVTATKRSQNIREVPQTIEAYSKKMLEDMGAKDVSDVVRVTPGVELRSTQPGVGGVAIRGITELNLGSLNGATGSATGLYIDEIPVTAAGLFPEINTFDLERVEILKGPQGTLFGEGSLAGTVRLITVKPDLKRLEAGVDASASSVTGGGKGHNLNAMVNVPLSSGVAGLRVTLFDREEPGYVDTRLTSTNAIVPDTNWAKTRGGRLSLRLQPAKGHTIDLTAMTSDAKRGGDTRATADFIGAHSVLDSATDRIDTGNLTYQFATPAVNYLATVSTMKRDMKRITDQLGLVALTNQLNPAFGLPLVTGVYAPQDVTTDTTTLEVRAVSNDSGPLKWTAGAFFKEHEFTYRLTSQSVPLTPPAAYAAISSALTGGLFNDPYSILSDTKARTRQTALFGEVSYDLTSQWQLLAGLRLFREQRNSTTQYGGVILYIPAAFGGPITPPGTVSSTATDNVTNPRVTVTYKASKDLLTYASMSRGFRSGGQSDLFFTVPGSSPTFRPEKLTSTELGVKSTHLGGQMTLDASLFLMDWKDLQITVGKGPGGAGEVFGNIGDARSTGADLSMRFRPIAALELQAGLTVIDAKTQQAVTLPDPRGNGTIPVASGARIPGTARQTASLSATYRQALGQGMTGLVRFGMNHRGDVVSYLFAQNQPVAGYTTADLRLGLEADRWSAYLGVTNLTNARIQMVREAFDFNGQPLIFWGRPRTLGLNLRYAFD